MVSSIPIPIQRGSPYSSRVSRCTNIGSLKSVGASKKSRPCFWRFSFLLASSHSNSISKIGVTYCNYVNNPLKEMTSVSAAVLLSNSLQPIVMWRFYINLYYSLHKRRTLYLPIYATMLNGIGLRGWLDGRSFLIDTISLYML